MDPIFRVVILDDEPWIAQSLAVLIDWEAEGFQVQGVYTDPLQALSDILSTGPDLILLDIRMPRMSGERLMERVREEGLASQFIIISAYSDFSVAQKAISLGAVGYVLKPVEKEELQNSVRRARKHLLSLEEALARREEEPPEPLLPGLGGKLQEYIQAHYMEKLTLRRLSQEFYLSASYVSDVFKRSTGFTVTAYITKVRLEHAARLLETGLPLAQAAGEAGYDDYNYFCRQFKKYYHMSPNAYRMRGKKEASDDE